MILRHCPSIAGAPRGARFNPGGAARGHGVVAGQAGVALGLEPAAVPD